MPYIELNYNKTITSSEEKKDKRRTWKSYKYSSWKKWRVAYGWNKR